MTLRFARGAEFVSRGIIHHHFFNFLFFMKKILLAAILFTFSFNAYAAFPTAINEQITDSESESESSKDATLEKIMRNNDQMTN